MKFTLRAVSVAEYDSGSPRHRGLAQPEIPDTATTGANAS